MNPTRRIGFIFVLLTLTAGSAHAYYVIVFTHGGMGYRQSLGQFRWILWRDSPVTSRGQNTTFQELAVETKED